MSTRFPLTEAVIVGVTLLAIALGGSVDLWAQTILAGIAGLLLLIAPPRGTLPRPPLIFAGALLLLALAAYLPASSLGSTPWLHYLASEAHIQSLATRTQQPWLTAQACSLLLVGLAWALYLLSLPWDKESRLRAAMALVFGVSLLALVAAAAFVVNFHIPVWHQEQNRGWFPNRNQTADVLAVVGLVNYALISDRLRRGKVSGYVLLAALVPIVTELVISYSRAGILLFFGGILAWHLWPRPVRDRDNSLKTTVLSAALGFVLLAVFLAWGGETLMRFESGDAQTSADFSDFRGAIQLDALRLSLQAPFFGVGLGNFEPIFAFSQVDSINGNRAIHPESDWLWLACEMGWFAPVMLVMAIVWWTRRCFPIEQKPGETLRRVFILATFVFLVHGLLDVGGHRLGSLWVGLLLASLALPFDRNSVPSRWTPLLFRALGLAVLLVAGWWLCSLRGLGGPPTTATLARLKAKLDAPDTPPAQLEDIARAALKIAPLDWNLYYRLGAIEAVQPGEADQAVADFATARALDPFWIEIPMDEGRIWDAANQPDLRLDTWKDALRRLGPEAHEAFRQMVADAPVHSIERQGLAELAFDRVEFLLMLLPTSTTGEADALLTHFLQKDPQLATLSEEQRKQLFAAWWTQGDQVRMMEVINQHPDWAADTWQYQAKFAAREMDFQHACEIAAKWSHEPAVPTFTSDQPLSALKDDFKNNPDTLTAGLVLYFAQMKQGQTDDALATLDTIDALSDHPAYIDYLEAQLYQQKQDWPNAWKSWLRFIGT
jgi:hypothetical protein